MSITSQETLYSGISAGSRVRYGEIAIKAVMIACSLVAVAVTVGIVLSLLFEAIQFFRKIPITEFLFTIEWSPQTALRSDQVAAEGKFGVIPLSQALC